MGSQNYRCVRIFVGIAGPHTIVLFPSDILVKTFVIRLEEIIDESLLNRQMTDLGAGGLQCFLDICRICDFEIGNFKVAGEDWQCADDEWLVSGAMLEFVVIVDGAPDDDDAEDTGMGRHQAVVDGFAAVGSARISDVGSH
jgi:hypothetical protein